MVRRAQPAQARRTANAGNVNAGDILPLAGLAAAAISLQLSGIASLADRLAPSAPGAAAGIPLTANLANTDPDQVQQRAIATAGAKAAYESRLNAIVQTHAGRIPQPIVDAVSKCGEVFGWDMANLTNFEAECRQQYGMPQSEVDAGVELLLGKRRATPAT